MPQTPNRTVGVNQYKPKAARFRAVESRDRGADGVFVYGVRSTGIYCRPSCPSRKPRPEQVVFFSLPEAAEQNGFRECRRCRPRTVNLRDPRTQAVAKVCREIESRLRDSNESPVTLSALSAPVRMSPHQLQRAFRSVMGISPRQYADAQRMRRLKSQ